MSKIKCNCTNDGKGNTQGADFQDKTYGKGIRIATTKLKVPSRPQEYVCTVCGKTSTQGE